MMGLALSALSAGCGGTVVDPNDDEGMSEAALSNPEHTAFNYFVSKGLTAVQAAGIVGNLVQESNVNPNAVQYGGGPGRGIAQWSVGGRWDRDRNDNVVWYAAQKGTSRWSLNTQLDFIWYELTNFSYYGLAQLKAARTIADATIAFQNRYEGCGQCEQSSRIRFAQQAYNAYAGSAGGGGGGGGSSGAGCYSNTLRREMPSRACVQSRFDSLWYQCENGAWVDRWSDPNPCNGVYPL
jgi:hypothetical protein